MRILTYNVRYFSHATRGLASTRKAMHRIASTLAKLDPLVDVMCLQEIETASLRSTLAHPKRSEDDTQLAQFVTMLHDELAARSATKKESYEAFYFPAHKYRAAGDAHFYTTGLAVLARKPIVIDHHNAGSPVDITHRHLHPIKRLKQTRICAHVRLRMPDGPSLDVFNTHLSLPSTMTREFWSGGQRLGWGPNQVAEAKNLARFVKAERKSEAFLVVGDFNALPGSPTYDYLTNDAGLFDVMRAREEPWPTAGFMRLRMRLDHVFTGSGLSWGAFEHSRPFGDKASPFHGLSDHVPLLATCRAA